MRYKTIAIAATMLIFAALVSQSYAAEPAAPKGESPAAVDLPKLAEKLPKSIAPKTAADVAAAGADLRQAVAALDEFLDQSGSQGEGWKKYLKWDQLQSALSAKEPDLAALKGVLDRFEADVDGLEMPQYVAARGALRNFLYVSLMARNPDILAGQLNKYDRLFSRQPNLPALLKAYGPGATHLESIGIGARIGELEKFGEAPELVSAVRKNLSHPNLTAYVGRRIVAAGIEDHLDQIVDIQEEILETEVTGKGHLTADVSLVLVPSDEHAVLQTVLSGQTANKTTGYHDPVQIYSTGVTQLNGTKQILISRDGLSATPATAQATTKTHVDSISSNRGSALVERKAWERVDEKQAQAEQIAGRLGAARLRQRMDAQAAETLAKANHDYAYKFHDPLVRRDAFPRILNFSTTDSAVHVLMQQAAPDQLAAPVPPAPLPTTNDLAVRLHESLLNNLAATNMGGRTITDEKSAPEQEQTEQLKKLQADIRRQKERNRRERFEKMSPEEQKTELARRGKADQQQRFSITLAKLNPITVEFRDGNLKLTIRGTEFVGVDEKKFNEFPMSIWVVYHVGLTADGGLALEIKDQGKDWGVMTTEAELGGPAPVGAEALRAKLKARFGDVFLDLNKIVLDPLVLPKKFKKAGKLAYRQAESKDGWLTLAWDQIAPRPSPQEKTAHYSTPKPTLRR